MNISLFGSKKVDLKKELARRNSRKLSMLKAFKKHGELNTQEINKFGTGCSSRLKELRKEGHSIVAMYERPGHFRYVYLGLKEDDGTRVSVVD